MRLRAQHALFDRLVYGKLRQALGGSCAYAISGGAPLGDRLGHFYRGIGLTVLEGYGLTETTAALSANLPDATQDRARSDVPCPARACGSADDGELLFRGGQVFAGYWRNEAATTEAVDRDGWFHTGDVGEVDDEGFVRITGRKKEILVTAGGKNVAPAVLEDRFRAHALVDQCLVVGDGQPFIGALVTIDRETLPGLGRAARQVRRTSTTWSTTPTWSLRSRSAVDEANKAVSRPSRSASSPSSPTSGPRRAGS